MKYGTGAALAAFAIIAGSAPLSSAARAEDAREIESKAVAGSASERLQRHLAARLQKDAEAIADGAMIAATRLDLTVELDLDKRPVSHTSVLLVSEL